jgi:uncharacterized protein
MKYRLEIYAPEACSTLAASFKSTSPFLAISVGDLINRHAWGENAMAIDEDWTLLRVVRVEHLLSEVGAEAVHHIMVFTEKAPDEPETRVGQPRLDLSRKDRVILFNQLLILEKLYPNEADDYAKLREAVHSGYALEYGRLAESVSDEFSREGCKEVYDILEMHRALNFSHKKAGVRADDVRFEGFDGNGETDQMAYARYLLKDRGLYDELQQKGYDYNSHFPKLDHYRAMLHEWRALGEKRRELSAAEIQRIISAR